MIWKFWDSNSFLLKESFMSHCDSVAHRAHSIFWRQYIIVFRNSNDVRNFKIKFNTNLFSTSHLGISNLVTGEDDWKMISFNYPHHDSWLLTNGFFQLQGIFFPVSFSIKTTVNISFSGFSAFRLTLDFRLPLVFRLSIPLCIE